MKKFLPIGFCLLLLSFSLVACSSPEPESQQNKSVEQAGAIVEAERVVTLTSLTSDILYRLDASKLVGIPASRLLREDRRFAELAKVSEGRTPPNLEKVVALQPDLVIGAEGFHDQSLKRLQELGIKTLSTDVDSWNALLQLTKTLAQVVDADPQPLLTIYQNCLANVADTKLSTLVIVSRRHILAPNKNSWAGDMLRQFRVQNLAADLQGNSPLGGYVTLSPEKILQANPNVILIVDPAREGILEQLKTEPFWGELQASQKGRVYGFDYYGLVNPGSVTAIEKACSQLQKVFTQQQS